MYCLTSNTGLMQSYLIAALISFTAIPSSHAREDIETVAIVTVYSGGKAVATYKAISKGRMEGNCYVFRVREGVSKPEVRVCGNFTVQDVP